MSLGWRGGVFSTHYGHALRLSASTCSKLVFLAFIGVLQYCIGFLVSARSSFPRFGTVLEIFFPYGNADALDQSY
jgi:hypothetical protein